MNQSKLTHGSLFSGIEGFGLGAAFAGIKTLWSCEYEDYQAGIIKKNFGEDHEINRDIRTYKNHRLLTSSAVDSLVKTSALLEKVSELSVKEAAYGLKCIELYGKLNLNTSSLKTAQCSFLEDSNGSYATFPKSGMMQSGSVYLVPTLAYNRVGSDYIVLPTPTKSTSKGAARNRYFGSPTYRGNIHEYIRDGEQDSQYPHPVLLENIMNFPIGWTERSV